MAFSWNLMVIYLSSPLFLLFSFIIWDFLILGFSFYFLNLLLNLHNLCWSLERVQERKRSKLPFTAGGCFRMDHKELTLAVVSNLWNAMERAIPWCNNPKTWDLMSRENPLETEYIQRSTRRLLADKLLLLQTKAQNWRHEPPGRKGQWHPKLWLTGKFSIKNEY